LTSPPADAVARAAAIAQAGFVVRSSILELSQGVIGMSMKSVKMLVAAVLLTCGLGLGVGSRWMANADAQQPQPKAPATKAELEAEIKRLQAELERVRLMAEAEELANALAQRRTKEQPTFRTKNWEYDLVEVSDISQKKFAEFLQDRENRGWEYNGTTVLNSGKPQTAWEFRRPAKVGGENRNKYSSNLFDSQNRMPLNQNNDYVTSKLVENEALVDLTNFVPTRLQEATYQKADLPLEATELAGVLR